MNSLRLLAALILALATVLSGTASADGCASMEDPDASPAALADSGSHAGHGVASVTSGTDGQGHAVHASSDHGDAAHGDDCGPSCCDGACACAAVASAGAAMLPTAEPASPPPTDTFHAAAMAVGVASAPSLPVPPPRLA